MGPKQRFVIGLLCSLILAAAVPAQQTTGTLRGAVTDDKGESIPGVTIEVTSPSMMSPRSTVSDVRGFYRFLYLPPGTYTVCAKLEGFETCWIRGVPVQIGTTSTADVTLKMGGLETEIRVTAEAPLIDLERSQKNYNVQVELLETVPLAPRANYVDVFFLLPGVAGASLNSPLVNAGSITHNLIPGATYFWSQHNQDDGYENKIMVDGMEINDSMSGTSYANFNYEAIQEIDVKTAGAGAEHGNARSAFMNIVTKSGGNTLKGSLFAQVQPRSFNWTNVSGGTANKVSYIIPNITVSGPILKDKLWFLASYKYNNEDYQYPDTVVVSELIRKTRGHMPYFKLTFQPLAKHTISLVYQDDYQTIDNGGFPSSRFSTEAAAQQNRQGGPMFSGTWRWLVSDSLYLNFVAGFNHKPRENWSVSESPRYSYTERFLGGSTLLHDKGFGEDYYSIRENVLISGSLTYYADDLFNSGAHEFKFGLDVRPYNHVTRTRKYWIDSSGFYRYSFGLNYADYGLTQPYVYRGDTVKFAPDTPQDRYDNEVIVSAESIFFQDTWVVSRNLAISAGLRWEHQRENMFYRDEIPAWMDAIYSGMRNNIEFDDSGLAPRLGVTYNWDKVGVFKFHYGRYFEYVGTGDYNNYSRTAAFGQFRMSAANIGKGPEFMTVYSDPPLAFAPDYNKDMKMEYNDEFTVSFEREILKNVAFDTTFIYRIINTSYMEDVNAVFQNGEFVGRRFPEFDTIWMRTWYGGDARRWKFDYKSLQFNVKRNFTGRWGLMANYSLMWRTYYKLLFDPTDAKQFVYASPRDLDMVNYGIRWAFHFATFYRLPWDILLSTFVNGTSGIFQADTTGDYAWDATAPTITLANGRRVANIAWQAKNNYFAGKKWGDQGRYTDDTWSVNVRLAKGVRLGKYRFEFACDVYNVFNWAAYSSYESTDIRRNFTDTAGINRYANKIGPQTPRAAQLTFKVEF
ncbi:MAG: TonB-dependent receptor [Candidatus Aminicenantes bacterium]|nr:TonB-dependent receptor [Candidatus Aminicenantes bacterium]